MPDNLELDHRDARAWSLYRGPPSEFGILERPKIFIKERSLVVKRGTPVRSREAALNKPNFEFQTLPNKPRRFTGAQ